MRYSNNRAPIGALHWAEQATHYLPISDLSPGKSQMRNTHRDSSKKLPASQRIETKLNSAKLEKAGTHGG